MYYCMIVTFNKLFKYGPVSQGLMNIKTSETELKHQKNTSQK
jgi:hypothetical protein